MKGADRALWLQPGSWSYAEDVFDDPNREKDVLPQGKTGLIVGIANENSIAHGCAEILHNAGAELAVTYLNKKAEPYVRPLAERLASPIIVPCDVREEGQLDAVFDRIRQEWRRLDFLLHSIAYAPREGLHARITDCSQAGFAMAMDVSCYSFIRMARLAEPLMAQSGRPRLRVRSVTWRPELEPKRIRVHALSPGPLKTRAASGIEHFDEFLERARDRTPEQQLVSIEDVGNPAAFLVSDGAVALTGNVEYIDAGYHIAG